MRANHYRGFTWHTVDYYEPTPTVAMMGLPDGSFVSLETYGPEQGEPDIVDLITDWWLEHGDEAVALAGAAADAALSECAKPVLRDEIMEAAE